MNAAPQPIQHDVLSTVVQKIASIVAGKGPLSTGDIAALRRMDPQHPQAAFFKIEGIALDTQLHGEESQLRELETRWAAVVVGLAHLGELHRPSERLGRALATHGYSELRFARLLRADAAQLVDELPLLARFLTAKSIAVDWTQATQLILSAEQPHGETTRRHIARDYYGTLAKRDAD